MVRFDYACKKCEKTFTVWSDEAKRCAYCGSLRVFKVFLTPPAAVTGKASDLDKLAEKQLEAAGLSNYTNVGGAIKRTRRTHPTEIAAIAAAKAHNIPIAPPTGPQTPTAMEANIQRMRENFRGMGANGLIKAAGGTGKTVITPTPRGPGALVNEIVHGARRTIPLAAMGQRILHPKSKEDSAQLKSLLGK